MPTSGSPIRIAVALDGAGWHPAAWREPGSRPDELFTARYWADLVSEAERGLLDFVTFEDSFAMRPAGHAGTTQRADQVRGRLDAVLVAARVAPLTRHIGLIPAVTVTHTEPFHISKAIATLDFVSTGRAGLQAQVSARRDEAAHFGRRRFPQVRSGEPGDPAAAQLARDLLDETADYVEVVRRLWDSWEDDAEIRDAATGRFVDRDKLHYIDFAGRWFSVRGPSITPRPPQGQPVITTLAHGSAAYQLAGRVSDVAFVTPRDAVDARDIVASIHYAQAGAGRTAETVHVFADLVVYLDRDAVSAADRKARLDDLAGEEYTADALAFTGTPAQLADLLQDWRRAGLSGFRLRPAVIPHDLTRITRCLVPELRERGVFRRSYDAATLRGLLGLPRPASRFVPAWQTTPEIREEPRS
jgi:alkanesulfonate monooxygenase SsuD/methylene tetrahydromethanopterin reductase-like flavin-dependent oxidoreductase (luciferase family)